MNQSLNDYVTALRAIRDELQRPADTGLPELEAGHPAALYTLARRAYRRGAFRGQHELAEAVEELFRPSADAGDPPIS